MWKRKASTLTPPERLIGKRKVRWIYACRSGAYFANPAALRPANLFLSPKPELVAPLLISASVKKNPKDPGRASGKGCMEESGVQSRPEASPCSFKNAPIWERPSTVKQPVKQPVIQCWRESHLGWRKEKEEPEWLSCPDSGSRPCKPREASGFSRATPGTGFPLPSGQMPAGRSPLWSDKRARLPSLLLQLLFLLLLLLLLQHG